LIPPHELPKGSRIAGQSGLDQGGIVVQTVLTYKTKGVAKKFPAGSGGCDYRQKAAKCGSGFIVPASRAVVKLTGRGDTVVDCK
jgi:hypothetical protein